MSPFNCIQLKPFCRGAALKTHQIADVWQANGKSDLILFSISAENFIEVAVLNSYAEAIIIPCNSETTAKQSVIRKVVSEFSIQRKPVLPESDSAIRLQ